MQSLCCRAVLRQKGIPNRDVESVAYRNISDDYGLCPEDTCANTNEFEALKNKAYLNALSIHFERLATKNGTGKKTREALCRFVKRHFPKNININY